MTEDDGGAETRMHCARLRDREWQIEIRDTTFRPRLFRSVSFLVSPLPPVNREAIAMRLLFAILLAVSVLSAVVHG